MMKRFAAICFGLILALGTLTACGASDTAAQPAAPAGSMAEPGGTASAEEEIVLDETLFDMDPANWAEYDKLIAEIKSTTDYKVREDLMHQAEDMVMETGALIPLYYYNDIYLQSAEVTGSYSNLYGFKYMMFVKAPGTALRLQFSSEPDHLDPALNSTVDGASLAVNSFAGLCTYGPDGKVALDLAADYIMSEDGLTYTVKLLPDLKWSNGDPLNAGDFVYSWNRAVTPETAADYGYMFDAIRHNEDGTLAVTASEDGAALTIELAAPCAYFLDLLAFPAYYPVHQESVEAANKGGTTPGAWCQEAGFVSNGAFTCTAWTHDSSMIYTKNPNYHRADEVKLETLEFMLSADDTAIYAAYNAGNLDFADTVPNDEITALLDNPEFHIADTLGTYYVGFNVNSPLFDGKTATQANAMRRAFALLVDREYIVENIGQTGQQPANTFIPAGMADGQSGVFRENDDAYTYPDADNVGYYAPFWSQENVAMAVELLKYAGYEFDENNMLLADTPISFNYLTNKGTGHVAIAEALQQDFALIGIEMTINQGDWNVFLDERKAGNYDVARNGWLADFNDPINMLEMWISTSGNNDSQLGK